MLEGVWRLLRRVGGLGGVRGGGVLGVVDFFKWLVGVGWGAPEVP